ncbi:MAG: NADH-quinone oxidoreductase subunit F [Paracoccaceae bacterium]
MSVTAIGEAALTGVMRPDRTPHTLADWRDLGGYRAVETALREHSPQSLRDLMLASNLRGRGGAGFATGKKWGFMPLPDDPVPGDGPRYLCVNADEMEPCTFKDRLLMEATPHRLVEGVVIAAYALGASEVWVLIRDAYRAAIAAVRRAVEEAYEAGYLGRDVLGTGFSLEVRLHESAGRYIVGEETALMESIEGRRPVPRQKPPYPSQSGLWGRPTTINNVESLCNAPLVVERGAEGFLALSNTGEGGTKLYGVSGRVAEPRIVEAPMGTTARDLIAAAGGMREGRSLLAFQPGGGSSGFLGPEHLDVPLDFDNTQAAGSWFGTGMLIVLDDAADPLAVVRRHMAFYARESCGWCVPCREGLPWVVRVLDRFLAGRATRADLELLHMHVRLGGQSFCALMGGAMDPLASALERFAGHFEAGLAERAA